MVFPFIFLMISAGYQHRKLEQKVNSFNHSVVGFMTSTTLIYLCNILVSFQWSLLSRMPKMKSLTRGRRGGVPICGEKQKNGLASTYSPRNGTPTKAEEQLLCQFVLRRIKNPGHFWPRAFCSQSRQQLHMQSTLCLVLPTFHYLTFFATTMPISFNYCCFMKVLKL